MCFGLNTNTKSEMHYTLYESYLCHPQDVTATSPNDIFIAVYQPNCTLHLIMTGASAQWKFLLPRSLWHFLADFAHAVLYFIWTDIGKIWQKKYKWYCLHVVFDELFECKTAAQHTQVISMLAISILLRSLEQINTCSTFAEFLMPNCLLSLRAKTAVKEIIFLFKCQDDDYDTAVLFRKRSRI